MKYYKQHNPPDPEAIRRLSEKFAPAVSVSEVRFEEYMAQFKKDLRKGASETTLPKRIQRKRTKGWRMPPNSKYVGRPTKYGNEYELPKEPHPDDYEIAARIYESKLRKGQLPFTRADIRRELRGWNLVCWCPLTRACHVDVLLKVANSEDD